MQLVLLILVNSLMSAAVPRCEENAVNVIEAMEPEYIECGEWWGDCSGGQEVGAGCIVECDDGGSDAVFIHCHEVECQAGDEGDDAEWEISDWVGCGLCREDGVDHVQAQHPGEGACGQHEGDCGAGQHVGASCTVMCGDDSDDPASAVCTELKCVSFGDMVSASWDILGDVDCRNNGEKNRLL